MRISIITPSFRNSDWLKLCIASVADQGVVAEHIIQDAGSDDGTLDWLPQDKRVRVFVEKDAGMYDAINRGLRRATGDVLAWLNCDEQYLPGALQSAVKFFETHPQIDVLFGNIVFTDRLGFYAGHRKVQTPLLYHTWTCHLSTLSCATFFRRRVVFEGGDFFNPSLRDSGDGEWMVRLLRRRVPMAALGHFTSVFTLTGDNMSQKPNSLREACELHRTAPPWARLGKPLIILHHRLRRLAAGMYSQPPFSFSLYTRNNSSRRELREARQPAIRSRH
jgi:glycosyltransferase involved in cell wall biosynthesis